jgi:hypothetical protein
MGTRRPFVTLHGCLTESAGRHLTLLTPTTSARPRLTIRPFVTLYSCSTEPNLALPTSNTSPRPRFAFVGLLSRSTAARPRLQDSTHPYLYPPPLIRLYGCSTEAAGFHPSLPTSTHLLSIPPIGLPLPLRRLIYRLPTYTSPHSQFYGGSTEFAAPHLAPSTSAKD